MINSPSPEQDHNRWPEINVSVVEAIQVEYAMRPIQFIEQAANRLQEEQPFFFAVLSRRALSDNNPHASMKWSLVFY